MPIIARPPGLPATSPHRQSRALARTARPDQSRSTRPPALCSTEPRQISLALPLVPLALDVATLTANSRAHRAAAQPLAPRRRPPDYPLRLGAVVPPSICRAAGALPTPGHSPLSRPALTLISHPRAPCIAPDEDRSEREIHSRGLGHTLTEFQPIDVEKGTQLSFDALCDLVAMDDLLKEFKAAEKQAIDKTQRIQRKDASLTVPGLGNIRAECKSFSQKADHVAVSLMDIIRLFYPEMRGKNWSDFQALIKKRYGPDDNFSKLVVPATKFLQLVRDTRDCLEHTNLEGVNTRDFEPQPDGTIAPPTIEIKFRQSSQERYSISAFMDEIAKAMLVYFQSIIVFMCSKTMRPFAGMPMIVAELPAEMQEAWHVRFGYGAYDQGGRFMPCG
jgi:hypothetical protein